MQNTVNLNLKKPDQNDFVNIGDINDNMDILDAEVAKKYVKPVGGIPKTDLSADVQSSLVKAESALQSVTKASVGLGNVDNTSDVNKPVSTAQQAALDKKANLASPILTGTPTAPTAAESTNTQQIATTAFVNRAVATHQAEDATNAKKGHVQLVDDVDGNSASLVPTQNAVRKKVEQTDYKVTKSGKDANGIFTSVEYRRKTDNTLVVKSVLSGGTSPKYTTRTLTYYGMDGTTVENTTTKSLSYDVDGDLISEV